MYCMCLPSGHASQTLTVGASVCHYIVFSILSEQTPNGKGLMSPTEYTLLLSQHTSGLKIQGISFDSFLFFEKHYANILAMIARWFILCLMA